MAVAVAQLTITNLSDGSYTEPQYASNTSEITAPLTGWSLSIPAPQVGYYVWQKLRTVYADGTYSTWSNAIRITGAKGNAGLTGQQGPQGLQGDIGNSAKEFTIIASSPTFSLSSRGMVKETQSIAFTCSLMNIQVQQEQIGWEIVGAATLSAIYGETVTATISTESMLGSFTIHCSVEGFGLKTFLVKGIQSGAPSPVYLGICDNEPANTNEGPLFYSIEKGGDFYLGFDNIPYYWNGSNFLAVNEDTVNYSQIMGIVVGDVLKSGKSIDVTSVLYGYFENLVAVRAFIDKLGTSEIIISKEGLVKTKDFIIEPSTGKPSSGFCLDNPVTNPETGERQGRIRANNAMFVNSTLYGKIIHDVLTTQEASPAPEVTIPVPTGWSGSDLITALASVSANTMLSPTGTFNGDSLTCILRKTTSDNLLLYSSIKQLSTEAVQTFTAPYTGNMFGVCTPLYSSGGVANSFFFCMCSILVNGVIVLSSGTNTEVSGSFTVVKGDVISITGRLVIQNYPPGSNNSVDVASLYIDDMAKLYHVGVSGTYLQSCGNLEILNESLFLSQESVITSPISFNSANSILYSSGSGVISQCTGLTTGVTLGASGNLTIDGTSRTITSVFYTGESLTLIYSGGSKELVMDSLTGWYAISGSFTPNGTSEGVIVKDIFPKSNDSFSIGGANRFLYIHGKNIIGENLTGTLISGTQINGSVNSQGTSNIVWGAVFN
jgi:hypothetical protein